VLNQGYCGSCDLSAGMAKWATLLQPAPQVYVVDCGWNMEPAAIANNTVPFVLAVRQVFPTVPIVMVEPSDYRPAWILGDVFNVSGRRAELQRAYDTLSNQYGMANLSYIAGEALLSALPYDPTFEGVHPLDEGHMWMTSALIGVIGAYLPRPQRPASRPTLPDRAHLPPHVVRTSLVRTGSKDWAATESRARNAGGRSVPTSAGAGVLTISPPAPRRTPAALGDMSWTPGTSLAIVGRFFNASTTPGPYNRLPSAAQATVRAAVWDLSLDSAGLMVGFASDTTTVAVNYTVGSAIESMVHFPATGVSGADLFAFDTDTAQWRFVAPAQVSGGVVGGVGG
jgi:hypothetical protein